MASKFKIKPATEAECGTGGGISVGVGATKLLFCNTPEAGAGAAIKKQDKEHVHEGSDSDSDDEGVPGGPKETFKKCKKACIKENCSGLTGAAKEACELKCTCTCAKCSVKPPPTECNSECTPDANGICDGSAGCCDPESPNFCPNCVRCRVSPVPLASRGTVARKT